MTLQIDKIQYNVVSPIGERMEWKFQAKRKEGESYNPKRA